jgi:hypothetical protein
MSPENIERFREIAKRPKSEATRRKLSEKAKQRPAKDNVAMAEMRAAWNGQFTKEAREKIRAANLGKKRTPEQRERMSAWQRGRKSDPAANAKRSATQKGRTQSPEHRAAIAAAKARKKAISL